MMTIQKPIFLILSLIIIALIAWLFIGRADRSEISQEQEVAAQSPMTLTSHKALYDVNLSATHGGSQIVNITGKMYYELRELCDSWATSHRFYLNYEYADGAPMQRTSDFSTYEAFDGSEFSFSSRRLNNGEPYEDIRGKAKRTNSGDVIVEYSQPNGEKQTYSQSIAFPMAHTREVMNAIAAKKTFFTSTFFDGSDLEGPIQVNAFLGKAVQPDQFELMAAFQENPLLNATAHHIRLAFFENEDEVDENNSAANYEMDMLFHNNGVIQSMDVDYKDFSITQQLTALEALPTQCESKSPKTPVIESE